MQGISLGIMIEFLIAIAGIAVVAKLLPPLILTAGFSYPNAKFNAIPTPYIAEREVMHLLDLKTITELKNNVTSRDFELSGASVSEIQENIDESFAQIVLMARKDSPQKIHHFYDAYLGLLDTEVMKQIVRSMHNEDTISLKLHPFSETGKHLLEDAKGKNWNEMIEILRKYGFEITSGMSIVEIERTIDLVIIKRLLATPLPSSCRKARDRFVRTIIDVINIKTLIRAAASGFTVDSDLIEGGWELSEWKLRDLAKLNDVPELISMLEGTSYFPSLRQAITEYEQTGVAALERAVNSYLIKAAGNISNDSPLSLGPSIRFLVEKQFEAENLRVAAKAISEGLQDEARHVVVIK